MGNFLSVLGPHVFVCAKTRKNVNFFATYLWQQLCICVSKLLFKLAYKRTGSTCLREGAVLALLVDWLDGLKFVSYCVVL